MILRRVRVYHSISTASKLTPITEMAQPDASSEAGQRRHPWWQIAWLILAIAYAVPVAYYANDRVTEVTRKARERLIVQYRLWELHPEYGGTPRTWTRFASRLLTDNQLLRRVRAKYGDLANDIELDYRRDLSIAQGEVIVAAAAAWAVPLAALYGLGLLIVMRRRRPPAQPQQAPERPAASDSRYRR